MHGSPRGRLLWGMDMLGHIGHMGVRGLTGFQRTYDSNSPKGNFDISGGALSLGL